MTGRQAFAPRCKELFAAGIRGVMAIMVLVFERRAPVSITFCRASFPFSGKEAFFFQGIALRRASRPPWRLAGWLLPFFLRCKASRDIGQKGRAALVFFTACYFL